MIMQALRKKLSLFLSFVMIATSFSVPAAVYAEEDVEYAVQETEAIGAEDAAADPGQEAKLLGNGDEDIILDEDSGFYFTVDNGQAVITHIDPEAGEVCENPVIPLQVTDDKRTKYTVKAIADSAFEDAAVLTGCLTIFSKNGISVGKDAFKNCTGLTGLVIGKTAHTTSWYENAFSGCTGIKKVRNDSSLAFDLSKVNDETWIDEKKDEPVNKISEGSAVVFNAQIASYRVTFNSNGGSEVEEAVVKEMNAAEKPAKDPTKKNYEFKGWYADKELKKAYDFATPVLADTILYAKWAKKAGGSEEYLDKTTGTFYFTVNSDGTATLTKMDKPEMYIEGQEPGDLIIPEKVTDPDGESYTVTAIGDKLAMSQANKGKLVIPDTVTSIGASAFADCSNLTGSLVIPDSVTSIGSEAFKGCEGMDGEITIGKNVTSIGDHAFVSCQKLHGDLIIPDSVISIGDYAFYDCLGLDGELKLGTGLQTIGANAFTALGGLKFKGSLTLSDNVISVGERAFYNCEKFDGTLKLGKNIQSIGTEAFAGCKGFTGALSIPDSVTEIGSLAFNLCIGFTGTTRIGTGLTKVDPNSFFACTGITRVVNNSASDVAVSQMSDTLPVTWSDENTGEAVTKIKLGTAVRSDYSPENDPGLIDDSGDTPDGALLNVPSEYSAETRTLDDQKFVISYCHKTPFYGKSKPGVENFSTAANVFKVSYNGATYKVTKVKVNKKKQLIQVQGLEGADKSVVKAIKKATKGANGLPFKVTQYQVSNKDDVVCKTKRDGSIRMAKISIFGKYYKAKKDEYEFNDKTLTITFKGDNLKGSFKFTPVQ